MKFRQIRLLLCILATTAAPAFAQEEATNNTAAETTETASYLEVDRYISDKLSVPMRSGAGNQYRILNRGLRSGTKITLLRIDESSGWGLIRTVSGKEGWIPKQYLLATPTASIKLAQAQRTIKQLSSKAGPLSEKLIESEKTNSELKAQLTQHQREKNLLNKELDRIKSLSSNAIALNDENKKLLADNNALQLERDGLKAENQRLSDQLNNDDFMYGAYAIILGIIATLIIQYFARSRNRSDWG